MQCPLSQSTQDVYSPTLPFSYVACWGLPLFRFPCGFHSSALLATCPSGLLNVWPIQPQALCLISCSIGHCPVCLQSSLLLIFLGHQIHRMFLKLLLMNACNFWSNLLVNLQVSEPCKSTIFTFDPNTLSLVLVVSAVDRHICLSIANACLAFLIRAFVESSDDVDHLGGHPVVPQQPPQNLSADAIEGLFKIYEVDIQGGLPLDALLLNPQH